MDIWNCLIVLMLMFVHLGHCFGGAANTSALLKALFDDQDYNPLVRPSLNYTDAMEVSVEVVFNSILSLDLKQQIMRTTGFFRFSWKDDLIIWNPDDYGGLSDIIVPQDKLWHPDVAFYNTVEEKRYPGSKETLVGVSHNGMVLWAPAFNLDTACKFDVTKYPFDIHICSIRIFSWMNDNTSVKLNLGTPPVQFGLVIENGEYKVEAEESFKLSFYSGKAKLHYDQLAFQVKLVRRPGYFILSLLMPVMLLSIMCSTSFLLAPDETDKLTVAITVLLSFTVFLGVIDQDMPEVSDNISLLVVYVSCMLAVGFLCVLGNIIVIKCNRWEAGRMEQRAKAEASEENSQALTLSPMSERKGNGMLQGFHDPNNQSDTLISEMDKISDRSVDKADEKDHHVQGSCGLFKCKYKCKRPKLSNVLNRLFFALNLGIVVSLTILMWILMLT